MSIQGSTKTIRKKATVPSNGHLMDTMKVILKQISGMVLGSCAGQMVLYTRENGRMVFHVGKAGSRCPMAL
jgi:hypothetical protein